MLWFFVIPCVLFLGWASFKLVNSLIKTQNVSLSQKVENLTKAKSKNSRWQAAYALSQSIFNKNQSKTLTKEEKVFIFKELNSLLNSKNEDPRLYRYILLTLSQLKLEETLAVFETFSSHSNPELQFYSAWGLAKLLESNNTLLNQKHLLLAKQWVQAPDPSLRKLASSFILNFFPDNRVLLLPLLSDNNIEVKWNTAIGFSNLGFNEGVRVHADIFLLKNLREASFKSLNDLSQILKSAQLAAVKINNPLINKRVFDLKNALTPNTPEGNAILLGLSAKN